MRIIGGLHRSRRIAFPDVTGLRPTPDRVRETLFNWLGQNLAGKRCLDLFAGSGVLGLEAASRHAAEVVMVESNRKVFHALQASVAQFPEINIVLYCEDAIEFIRRDCEKFDVIFLDPPFQKNYLPELLPKLTDKITGDSVIYIETGVEFEPGEEWQVLKRGRAGAVHYQLVQFAKNTK
ncbi:MAG: 16S rRNA (guanine(966)-N(2))-methyltransferase RsmD [Candidatus Nitrotoga sp.]